MGKVTVSNEASVDTPSSGNTTLFIDSTTKTLKSTDDAGSTTAYGSGGGGNSFETMSCPSGTNPVADSSTDTLNLTSADSKLTITGTAGTDTIDFAVVESAIDHDALTNFVSGEHILHSGVDIGTSATSGLSGGGDISSTRALVVDPSLANAGTVASLDEILVADVGSSDALIKVTAQSIADLGGGGLTAPLTANTMYKLAEAEFLPVLNGNSMVGDSWLAQGSSATASFDAALNSPTSPGVFRVGSGTSSSWARVYLNSNSSLEVGTSPYMVTALWKLSAIPDATDNFEFATGFSDNVMGSGTDKCLIGADISISATNFSIDCGNGTDSEVDTGIAMDTNYHVFQVYMRSATSCLFYIDGVEVHEETTNFPSGDVSAYLASYRWIAGAARYGAIDYGRLDASFTSNRGVWKDPSTI